MNSFASLSAIALLAIGCAASTHAVPATTAGAPRAQAAHTPQAAPRVVELRHFYLLSPGPHATLVVSGSDLGSEAAGSSEASNSPPRQAAPFLGLQ
ncbi:MAG TPA: hypothetical protein VGJ91_21940 [Polyangiaceae bacterium]|jgi:hypothetical protein